MIRLAKQGEIRQNPADYVEFRGFRRFLPEINMSDDSESLEAGEVRFKPSPQLWKYLGWLARNTVLGRNEHEVAKQVLTTKLSEMRKEEYNDPQKV
jgi:hypothetical protein